VDKLATISLYMTVKWEDGGSNKDRVNIIQWLGVENTQFGTTFLFMWLRGASHWTGHCLLFTDKDMIPAM
jgi:hypothetical protein